MPLNLSYSMSSEDEKAPAIEEEKDTLDSVNPTEESTEPLSPLESPAEGQSTEAIDEDDDESVGYEESAERDEIIRERINRTQESMR